jgi:uncharacterized protein YyaL (SSP411 family)
VPNRLINEKSPYLLQHARNPVDWYPWSEEAFSRARTEQKPIFLSIGYSTCHWCHVMEQESFESERIAALLNEFFIPIKVDREERPDVDRLYMTALQSMGESGGWPMSMFLTPDLQPFYGGTYFPPVERYGRIGFPDLLTRIHEAWLRDREHILATAGGLIRHLRERVSAPGTPAMPGPAVLTAALEIFRRTFDRDAGGFGGAPKFPRPSVFSFLLRMSRHEGGKDGAIMTATSLRKMAEGGIYDHLGGGFHRYSVDAAWRVPHFEKMLYDQAQLVCVLLETVQATGDPFFALIARETLAYVRRGMTGAGGGFFSAEDADSVRPGSEGVKGEGAFYLWSMREVVTALPADEAKLFTIRYGVREQGNVPSDPHGEFGGMNILYVAQSVGETARLCSTGVPETEAALDRARTTLGAQREGRPRPLCDDKILAGWNGLMISACARAARVLGDPGALLMATAAAKFLLTHLRDPGTGALVRRWRDGEARFHSHLDDYAFVCRGLLDLYEASFEVRWLREALALTRLQIAGFWDEAAGTFFDTSGEDPSVLVRSRELYDGAEPSGIAVAAMNLLRLAHITGEQRFKDLAMRVLASAGDLLATRPDAAPSMAAALDIALGPVLEIVVAGERNDPATQALLRTVAVRYLPNAVTLLHCGEEADLAEIAPFISVMGTKNGLPAAYVCRDHACQLPVTDPQALADLLGGAQ